MHSVCSRLYSLSDLWVHYRSNSVIIKNITLQSLPSYEDVKSKVATKTAVWRMKIIFIIANEKGLKTESLGASIFIKSMLQWSIIPS